MMLAIYRADPGRCRCQKLNTVRTAIANALAAAPARWYIVRLGSSTGSERAVCFGDVSMGSQGDLLRRRAGWGTKFKWFKTGCVFSDTYFSMDINATDKAIEIVQKWNDERLVDETVQVNEAQVWALQDVCPGLGDGSRNHHPRAGERCLVEPFIKNYQKLNSNSSWCDCSSPWARLMQALSHYSYHISKGELLLCDLQGGCYQSGVVLTDPVIMSHDRRYGVTDLGGVAP
ncbi:hypothetical protein BSKO_02577 [Bryopsis sp. KO-2023]|nr:hypothetical protein BSKO_02577 [Bryopsis sp. KO-2023]